MSLSTSPVNSCRTWSLCVSADEQLGAEVAAASRPRLLVPSTALPPGSRLDGLVTELEWIARPTQEGGWAICPHLGAALKHGAVLVGSVPEPRDATDLADDLRSLGALYPMVHRAFGRDGHYASLVIDVAGEPTSTSALVAEAHRLAKADVIRFGALIGEFGVDLAGGGTRFPHVETRRSSYGNYVAMRQLMRVDAKYMSDPVCQDAFNEFFSKARAT